MPQLHLQSCCYLAPGVLLKIEVYIRFLESYCVCNFENRLTEVGCALGQREISAMVRGEFQKVLLKCYLNQRQETIILSYQYHFKVGPVQEKDLK